VPYKANHWTLRIRTEIHTSNLWDYKVMKKNRQTIRFTDEQIKKLRELSNEKKKTISQLLREMVQKI
jgi:hypothetical protein